MLTANEKSHVMSIKELFPDCRNDLGSLVIKRLRLASNKAFSACNMLRKPSDDWLDERRKDVMQILYCAFGADRVRELGVVVVFSEGLPPLRIPIANVNKEIADCMRTDGKWLYLWPMAWEE